MDHNSNKPATVIYINAEIIGGGDQELGAILMRNFLSTLGDFVRHVSHILLINSGVKIACQGSAVLDSMTMLEENGIEVLSCKTCLNHFNLQDKIMAGRSSNMFEILTIITRAQNVLTP